MTTATETTFSRNLIRIRTEKNMTVESLAARIGHERGFIENLESGKLVPRTVTVACIAKQLDCNVAELHVDEGN